jgi:hypothetical protein
MLQFGKSWLEKELQKYYEGCNPLGLSSDEFAETVVTMLNSDRSNDELQNEVSRLIHDDVDLSAVSLSFFHTAGQWSDPHNLLCLMVVKLCHKLLLTLVGGDLSGSCAC